MDNLETEYVKFQMAIQSFMDCRDYLNIYRSPIAMSNDDRVVFVRSLSKSFVVTYAKPFTNMYGYQGKRIGSVKSGWIKDLSKELRETHNYLLKKGRNSFVAHLDIGVLEPGIHINDGNDFYVFNYTLPEISDNTIDDYTVLINSGLKYFSEMKDEIKPKLKSDRINPIRYA